MADCAAALKGLSPGTRAGRGPIEARLMEYGLESMVRLALLLRGLSMRNALLLAVGLTVFSPLGHAQDIIDATDPEEVRNIARGYGAATLVTDSDGDPKIEGRIEGKGYSVHFYGCEDGKNCRSINLATGWATEGEYTVEQLNDWNRDNRFVKAYIDEEGDPILEMDVNLHLGVTRQNLDKTFDWWSFMMGEFTRDVIEAGK